MTNIPRTIFPLARKKEPGGEENKILPTMPPRLWERNVFLSFYSPREASRTDLIAKTLAFSLLAGSMALALSSAKLVEAPLGLSVLFLSPD